MSTEDAYFDAMYAASADPWGFTTRWYEHRKRDLTTASLPRERYGRAFEPGCSIGALTRALAGRCDSLLAWEGVPTVAAQAERDLADLAHVRVEQARIPRQWPEGDFDLIVLSELLYYFDDADLAAVLAKSVASLRAAGTLIAVHWQHPVGGHARSGASVHAALDACPGLARTVRHSEADFLLDVHTVGGAVSVAEREGLV
ncbi:nodulation protein S (NodS) [Murinocardiopsis flavida]|uniref:Nodulation protein S (NodS) n=1 Tax=Murinocardiopsis flavida TaxID=645275 RepID=A0A2P8CR93_9ACTN|nr:SAM-dependent methyltransferase [Murinocardiopsis flavida]PSK87488.1 nodulation protein S (NodS) [Murinocardiopsis flavida]